MLLARGKALELLRRLVHLLVGGLLLPALHALVLIAQLLPIQLEEVGKVLGARALNGHRSPERGGDA